MHLYWNGSQWIQHNSNSKNATVQQSVFDCEVISPEDRCHPKEQKQKNNPSYDQRQQQEKIRTASLSPSGLWGSLATSLERPAQTTEMVISYTAQSKKLFAFYSAVKYINQRISCKLLYPLPQNKKPRDTVPEKQHSGSTKGQNISSSS